MLDLTTTPSGTPIVTVTGNYPNYPGATLLPLMPMSPWSGLTVPAWWRAMDFLSSTLARLPRTVVKDGTRPAEGQRHRAEGLLRRFPNDVQNPFTFYKTLFFHAAHRGRGYARVLRDRGGIRPTALLNLMPEDVYPIRYRPEGARQPQQFYVVNEPGRKQEVLRASDVVHLMGLSYDGLEGLDPMTVHAATLQRAALMDTFQTFYLQKGTIIRGAIEIPGALSEERMKAMQSILRDYFRGPNSERDILFLTDGAKLNNATTSPQDSQLIQQGEVSTKQVAQITGIPPVFLMEGKDARYNNSVSQAGTDLVRYCLGPWIEQIESEFTLKLLSEVEQEAGWTVRINPDALMRGDTEAQMNVVAKGVTSRIYTPNEGRDYLGMPKNDAPDADQLKAAGDTSPPPAAE